MKLLRRKQKNFLYSVISLIVLLAFLWIYTETGTTPSLQKSQQKNKEPDFFVMNMKTTNYDGSGNVSETVNSKKALSFGKGRRNELKDPIINLYDQQKHTWQITAKKGFIYKGGSKVDLKNNVVIASQDNENKLTTSALTMYPEDNIAENSLPVTITTPQGITTSVGMKADLNKQHTHLKQQVKGEYHATP